MASLTDGILEYLSKTSKINSLELAKHFNEDHQKIVGAIKSIQTHENIICCEQVSSKHWELTNEGKEVVEKGSHEALVYHAVPLTGISQAELMKQVPNAKVGFSKAMSSGWIQIDKSAKGGPKIVRKVEAIDDSVQQNLTNIQTNSIPDNLKQEYKKRKLLQEIIVKSYDITKGSDFTLSLEKAETDLTPEMISTGSWKEKKFKEYNFDALGVPPTRGHLHPLMRVRTQFRQIFLEMGFSEMPTNNFIESSFWNFDALFQPQQHPARDAHDTFFISDPQYATKFPMEYLERVRRVHQHGAYGSQGYKYEWKLQDAQKNLLRTHTTAVSARMLYKLAQQETFKPAKYFSIDRVFRNETLDATHLAEFFQIEGVVADYGLTLGNLIGILYEFFKKLGIEKLRFKPAYNPYTEPSMEIFSYHEGLKKWVEVGNSGMFRPEMLLPMGLPEKVKVIAWGLSLERPTMIKFGIDNIRDLVGHKVNLQMVYEAPICRLDKGADKVERRNPLEILEARQESILKKLSEAQKALENLIRQLKNEQPNSALELKLTPFSRPPDVEKSKDIVILATPHNFPLSVLILCQQLGKQRVLSLHTHCHSDLSEIPPGFSALLNGNNITELTSGTVRSSGNVLRVTLILTDTSENKMIVSPIDHIAVDNEVNIARYLARHLDPPYDADPVSATMIDQWLDEIQQCLSSGNAKLGVAFIKIVNFRLKSNNWLTGNALSLADIVLWSALHTGTFKNSTPVIKEWVNKCSKLDIFSLAKKIV